MSRKRGAARHESRTKTESLMVDVPRLVDAGDLEQAQVRVIHVVRLERAV